MWLETVLENLKSWRYDRFAMATMLAVMVDSEEEAIERLGEIHKHSVERLDALRKDGGRRWASGMEYEVFIRIRDFTADAQSVIEQVAKVKIQDDENYVIGLS